MKPTQRMSLPRWNRGHRARPSGHGDVVVMLALVMGVWRLGALVTLAGFVRDEPSAAELRNVIGPAAHSLTTPHFVVAYDTPPETVQELIGRLEATYRSVARFCAINDLPFKEPDQPLEILLFDRPEGFYRYAKGLGVEARGLSGFYHLGTQRTAFFNTQHNPYLIELQQKITTLQHKVNGYRGRKLSRAERAVRAKAAKQLLFLRNRHDRVVEQLNRSVIQHEAAHHLLFSVGVHPRDVDNPSWLVEGLACLFETPPKGKSAGLGAINQMRLTDFREACGENLSVPGTRPTTLRPRDLRKAFRSERFLPLEQLLAKNKLAADPSDGNVSYYYAEAWGLTYYLQRTQRKKFAGYIRKVAQRPPGVEIDAAQEVAQFEAAFGRINTRFEQRWAKFVFDLRFTPPR